MADSPAPLAPIRALLCGFAAGERSPADALASCLAAIDRFNPAVNALPTLLSREALHARAERAGATMRAGDPVGLLAGLPYAAKDTHRTAGVRTTRGSPIFADDVPSENDPVVQRLLDADAILIGKSNTPEFAAGSQTFNPVLGTTRSPWALDRTVGGSSGGAAAALATGMAVVADGSDLAASLRNPASFCGVVGMRPSSIADPTLRMNANAFSTLSMVGPLARSVDDLRLIHRAMFAPAPRRPIGAWARALAEEGDSLGRIAGGRPRAPREMRLAWSIDCNATMPVADPVRTALLRALEVLREAGVQLVEAAPDFSGADECFQVLRGEYFVEMLGDLYRTERARMKDTVVWNVEYGLSLSAQAIAHASLARSAIFERVRRFVEPFDAWLLPTAQVLPFSIDLPYPTEINGRRLDTYIDWLKSCYWVSASGHPGISVPGGFASDAGAALPVGLQLVGHWGRDESLMDVAQTVETLLAPLTQRRCPPPAT